MYKEDRTESKVIVELADNVEGLEKKVEAGESDLEESMV